MLQLVQIEACFSLTSLHWVLHLLFLCVSFLKNCYKMKELVNGEKREIKGDDAITAFLKLKHLTIVHLQKLVKINSWVFLLKINSCELDRFPTSFWGSLGAVQIWTGFHSRRPLSTTKAYLIKCERKWWERLEWVDATVQSQFCSNSKEDEDIAEFFNIFQKHGYLYFSLNF